MDADLDLLLHCRVLSRLTISCLNRRENARRIVTDAEVVTLCVAQAIMGIPSRPPLPQGRPQAARAPVPELPEPARVSQAPPPAGDTIEWLMGVFASDSPGFHDDLVLVDSTPVECARSLETVKRSQLADAADYGYCASHSRYFWGFRLHACSRSDGTPRALRSPRPRRDERDVGLDTARTAASAHGGETVLGDKGYAGREFAAAVSELDATIVRPRRKDEPGHGPHLAPIRQRIESIFWTCKDLLTLERHGARTLARPQRTHPRNASSASPPRSPSTTNSAAHPAHSSTTPPEPVESTHLGREPSQTHSLDEARMPPQLFTTYVGTSPRRPATTRTWPK